MQFGHIVKIHSINTYNKRKRDKNNQNYGEGFHNLVHFIILSHCCPIKILTKCEDFYRTLIILNL